MRAAQRGQAIVEYLVIVTVIVASFLVVKTQMKQAAGDLYNAAKDRVEREATRLGGTQMTDGKVWN